MNQLQYRLALRAIDSFMANDPEPGTYMGDALDALAKLCEQYEREHFPIGEPSPEELAAWRAQERAQ